MAPMIGSVNAIKVKVSLWTPQERSRTLIHRRAAESGDGMQSRKFIQLIRVPLGITESHNLSDRLTGK